MPAAYDTYDYPSYWEGRQYEHLSEVHAVGEFLKRIKKTKKILEIGAGYGRLTESYLFRGNKIILADPSGKLLKIARRNLKDKNIKFIQAGFDLLNKKIKGRSVDLILMVRVLHHIENLDDAFQVVYKLLKKNGYFILEFPNKRHWKEVIKQLFKGNFTFILDIFPKDIGKKRKKNLPFKNYHPDMIFKRLEDSGFEIIETRSVSNIRDERIKKLLPLEVILWVEKYLQIIFSPICFGPSTFILSRKKDK